MCGKIFGLFLLVCLFKYGESIRCFECNSVNNSMCLDPLSYDKDTLTKFMDLVDCNAKGQPTRQEYFCRKMVQSIIHKGNTPDVRVSRSCGWIKHKRDCYKADNEDHLETVCACYTDGCNSAHTLLVRGGLITCAAAALLTRLRL